MTIASGPIASAPIAAEEASAASGVAITGVSGTTAAGSVTENHPSTVSISGVSATGSVGNVSKGQNITGVSSTASVGNVGFTKSGSLALTGVVSTTNVGSVGITESGSVQVTGVFSTLSVGSVAAVVQIKNDYFISSPIIVSKAYGITSIYPVDTFYSLEYPIDSLVNASTDIVYDIQDTVSVNAFKNISSPIIVSKSYSIPYSVDALINGSTSVQYEISSTVNNFYSIDSEILSVNKVSSSYSIISPIDASSVQTVTSSPFISIAGNTVDIVDGDVSTDEGSIFWEGNFTVPDQKSYDLFSIHDSFQCNIYGQIYELVVDSKTKSRTAPENVEYRIKGLSPVSLLQKPVVKGITVEYSSPVLASTVVSDMLPGVSVSWGTIDWLIPANRLSVEDADPLQVAVDVVNAVGGILQCQPDGSIKVQYQFPVSPTQYSVTAEDFSISTSDDIFSFTQIEGINEFYNRIEISDIPPSDFSDSIVFDEGILKGFTKPFDSTAVIDHTSGSFVTLNRVGVVSEQIGNDPENEEIVEIRNGQGSTTFPILTIDSFTYMEDNLGGLSFEPDTSTFNTAIDGYSLVKIVYTTRYIKYTTSSTSPEKVQFILKRDIPDTA